MGQVIPFRRETSPTFTDAEIEQMWETYAAASRVRAMVFESPNATEADRVAADHVTDTAQRLFADSFRWGSPEC